jgi:hypothetical protein
VYNTYFPPKKYKQEITTIKIKTFILFRSKRNEVRKMEFEIEELETTSPKHPWPCSSTSLAIPY